MGVWHFLSLGKSPGAVTSALAYIKKRYEKQESAFFGGDSNRSSVKKVSGIVIFTTPEVRNCKLSAQSNDKYIDNLYGTDKGKEHLLGNTKGQLQTFKIVMKFIQNEFQQMLSTERGKVYWLEANYHDLDFNLNKIVHAFLTLCPPHTVGKEIWVNLTGGSNVMNIAALLVTVMSGVTGRAYYTYTSNSLLLRPADETGFWYDIPVLKVNFDKDYEAILRVLDKQNDWIESDKLLSQVKQCHHQFNAGETFAQDYLNKLDGWLIERQGNSNRLSSAGQRFLRLMDNEQVKALVYKERLQSPLSSETVFEDVTPW